MQWFSLCATKRAVSCLIDGEINKLSAVLSVQIVQIVKFIYSLYTEMETGHGVLEAVSYLLL